GLAWTETGGETLIVEVNTMPGKGNLQLTGQLGDIMKESAHAAFSYIKSHAASLGVDPSFQEKMDVHIHIPEGAIPKDGPSAGTALCIALISAISKRPVSAGIAMTGEITLRGRVLPIGGLKEKLLAALRAGIKTVIFPAGNSKDLDEIPKYVKDKLNLIPAAHMDEIFGIALASMGKVSKNSKNSNGNNGHHKIESGKNGKSGKVDVAKKKVQVKTQTKSKPSTKSTSRRSK
ncbi:MAG: hypothetical protein K2X81_24105, partial [Candidatus Obscuribacterales bacterium]|nr:hypothetical protein [Candidatus Obscuribacterales bacterium]